MNEFLNNLGDCKHGGYGCVSNSVVWRVDETHDDDAYYDTLCCHLSEAWTPHQQTGR